MRLPRVSIRLSSFFAITMLVAILAILAGVAQAAEQRHSPKKGQLVAHPPSLNFGNVQVGSSDALTETLTNGGVGDLTIYHDQISGAAFSVSGVTFPITLKPGHSYTLTVTFAPTKKGSATGTASFGSKEWRKKIDLPLSGTGVAAGGLTVSPTAENFGNVKVGSSAAVSGTLAASGTSVTVSSATSSNAQFVLSGLKFPFTLSAGKTAAFTVTFTPQTKGAATGTLSFFNNSPVSPVVQTLSGTGVISQHTVSLSWHASTSVVVGYNIYRGIVKGGPYTKVNTAVDPSTAYTDASVVNGDTYYYVTTAVDSTGTESVYSNEVRAVIPGS